jgi:hypothetical protein
MKAYQQTLDDHKVRSLDLNAIHSWDDVMRLVKDSEAKYLEAGRSGPRRVTRFIGAYSESVLPFLRLIPNGFYTSIICGGLRLVFEVSLPKLYGRSAANTENRLLSTSVKSVRRCWLYFCEYQISYCKLNIRWKPSTLIRLFMTRRKNCTLQYSELSKELSSG